MIAISLGSPAWGSRVATHATALGAACPSEARSQAITGHRPVIAYVLATMIAAGLIEMAASDILRLGSPVSLPVRALHSPAGQRP